jgi:transcriptional regulator with XRE-family HTH domain
METNEESRTKREHAGKDVLLQLIDGAAMTQEEIAQEIGVSVRTVSRWWRGHAVPSRKHLEKLIKSAASDQEGS